MFFLETAQQVLFAQHLLLQASRLGAFDRTHDAAGIRSGATVMANTTVNRMAAVFRILSMSNTRKAARRSGGFYILTMEHSIERRKDEEGEKGRTDNSADNNRSERSLNFGAGTGGKSHRYKSEGRHRGSR